MAHSRSALAIFAFAASTAFAAPPTTNPADPERQAIAMMLDPNEADIKFDDLEAGEVTDAKVGTYLARRHAVLELIRQATAMPHADWGETADVATQLTDLKGARNAIRLAWLAARSEAGANWSDAAVNDLLDAIALARHIGQRKLLICHMVDCGCEAGSIDRLAQMLPALPADVVRTLPAKLDALPPAATLSEVIEGERVFGQKMFAQQLNGMAARAAAPRVADENAPPPDLTPRGRAEAAAKQAADAKQARATQAAIAAQANGSAPFYEAVTKAARQTPAAFEASVKQAAAALPLNTFVQVVAPSLARQRLTSAIVETKRAMLRAAISSAINGPHEMAKHKDPFGDGSFKRAESAGGYTLTGVLAGRGGEPVSLQVGK